MTAPKGGMAQQLVCAVCLYDEQPEPANLAVTVLEGYAVCYEHLGFVAQGQRWAALVRTAREQPINRRNPAVTPRAHIDAVVRDVT